MKVILNFPFLYCFFSLSTFTSGEKVDVSNKCLNCICEASTGCDKTAECDGPVCGPYRISLPYWIDAGSPTLSQSDKNNFNFSDQAYRNCANNFNCASRAVKAYMKRYAKDCDGDGLVNCDDYARIHRNGPLSCSSPLDNPFKNAYERCMSRS